MGPAALLGPAAGAPVIPGELVALPERPLLAVLATPAVLVTSAALVHMSAGLLLPPWHPESHPTTCTADT